MNNIENAIIESLCDITGLDTNAFKEIKDLNLFENGILDSLSLVNFVSDIEDKLDIEVDFTKYSHESFFTINSIIDLVNRIVDERNK